MLRIKPITILIMFMPVALFLLLVIYIYQRRQQFEVVFSFGPDSPSPPDELLPQPELVEARPKSQQKLDDLKKIEGIGPKIATVLNNAGITTFAALSQTDAEMLTAVIREAGIRVAFPQTWPKQAHFAAAEDWGALTEYQSTLVGGREV